MTRPAVFLDRDGVLVEEVHYPQFGEVEAPMRPEDVRLLPGAAMAARRLHDIGFQLILVSNQGAAAKGKATLGGLWATHQRFVELMQEEGCVLDGEFYSYSHPDGVVPGLSGTSLDRKPSPYNLLVASARFGIDLAQSWMVGDRETDVLCGKAAGVRTIRVGPALDSIADAQAETLGQAADIIAVWSRQQ